MLKSFSRFRSVQFKYNTYVSAVSATLCDLLALTKMIVPFTATATSTSTSTSTSLSFYSFSSYYYFFSVSLSLLFSSYSSYSYSFSPRTHRNHRILSCRPIPIITTAPLQQKIPKIPFIKRISVAGYTSASFKPTARHLDPGC